MLLDGRAMKNAFPHSFSLPSAEQLASITPGTFLKVCANDERFWVCVLAVDGDTIDGRIDNEMIRPLNRAMFKCGDAIRLHPRHVLDVQSPQMKYVFANFAAALARVAPAGTGRDLVMPVDSAINRPKTVGELFMTYMTIHNLSL